MLQAASAGLPVFSILLLALAAQPPPLMAGADASVEGSPAAAGRKVMQLTSPGFDPGGRIPVRYTCDGEDLSPPLDWTGIPEGTASFALVMDDPDAPPGTWVHWVLYDLPGDTHGLPEGVPKEESLDGGARHGACWGVDRYSRTGYYGPCPPPGSPHHYSFRLYALDADLDLEARSTKEQLVEAMKGHVLAEAELIGLYGR